MKPQFINAFAKMVSIFTQGSAKKNVHCLSLPNIWTILISLVVSTHVKNMLVKLDHLPNFGGNNRKSHKNQPPSHLTWDFSILEKKNSQKPTIHCPCGPATFPFTRKFTIQRMKILVFGTCFSAPKKPEVFSSDGFFRAFRVDHHLLGRVQRCTWLADFLIEKKVSNKKQGVRYIGNPKECTMFQGNPSNLHYHLHCLISPKLGNLMIHDKQVYNAHVTKTDSWLVEVFQLTTWFFARKHEAFPNPNMPHLRENRELYQPLENGSLGMLRIPVASKRPQYWILY